MTGALAPFNYLVTKYKVLVSAQGSLNLIKENWSKFTLQNSINS